MQDKVAGTTSKLDEVELREELRSLRTLIPDSPWLNPIQAIAFDLSRRLEADDITIKDLREISTRLLDHGCTVRASRLKDRIGFETVEQSHKEFAEFVRGTAAQCQTLEEFAMHWGRARTGAVLTAHPTFGVSKELSRRMVELATGPEGDMSEPISIPHRPNEPIDLTYEHERAQGTLANLRDACQDLHETFMRVAIEIYGEEALKLDPKLVTIASWVGYDLDGRTDITWTRSLELRLQEKRTALEDIRTRFLAIDKEIDHSQSGLQRLSRQTIGKLDLAIASVTEQLNALAEVIANGGKGLSKAANVITRSDGYNITSTKPVTNLIDEMIEALPGHESQVKFAALKHLIQTAGLGTAHIHLRINAAQLSNALRAFVHEPWATNLSERQSLARLSEMIEQVSPESVNFGTLDLETATAIRQLALVAQIKKYVDSETPIRFLIAESESPATILIAVFFAKLFGVDDIVDISPLFETPTGLERGARIMEQLLQEPAYQDYVRGRGRLSIQTGFSDAGRFVGQISATLAIERMHRTLAQHIADTNLENVETLIFSTHGESMGRGAHPGTLHDRLQYVLSPRVRRSFSTRDLALKHETSFQGGDGFMFFGNRELTVAALSAIIQDGKTPEDDHDPFYDDDNLTLDFYLRLRSYQQDLFAHPGYRALLGAYGANLLFKTGSRAVKRQSDTATAVDRGDPSRMRAIPNNAILQQFGYIANVVAGIGAAAGYERDKIVSLGKSSPRLRLLLEMVARGKQVSSLNAMGANAAVFDAGFWASRASWGREPELETAFRTLSTTLLADTRASDINGLMHHVRLDA
ncbi:MAG: phosphoenolpyruvate carboxylase, partial [Pseudomonadota bacterium]